MSVTTPVRQRPECQMVADIQKDDSSLEKREIWGYLSTWGVDNGGDQSVKGCFEKTLNERFKAQVDEGKPAKIKLLYQHDRLRPIGVFKELREDDKGLFFRARLDETPDGENALIQVKSGSISQMSMGGWLIQHQIEKSSGVRLLKEVKLREGSLVTFAENEECTIDGYQKNLQLQRQSGTEDEFTKQHPIAADICGRLRTAARTIEGECYYRCDPGEENSPPDPEIITGVITIIGEVLGQLKALIPEAEAAATAEDAATMGGPEDMAMAAKFCQDLLEVAKASYKPHDNVDTAATELLKELGKLCGESEPLTVSSTSDGAANNGTPDPEVTKQEEPDPDQLWTGLQSALENRKETG